MEKRENTPEGIAENKLDDLGIFDMPDFDIPEFDMSSFDIIDEPDEIESRYMKPKIYRPIKQSNIKYENAEKLAKQLTLGKNERANVIVPGSFIFGDFIEAYIVANNAKIKKMTVSTLSLSQDNVDSMANLIKGGFVDELNLIISHYFFANERNVLIPYIYQELDTVKGIFQLAVAGSHTKTVTFETLGGKFIVMHGSANLRSSQNLEQFTIEENEDLYRFYDDYQDKIIDKYKTINKAVRVKALWNLINTKKLD
jgi:hypothetical protein